MNINSSFLSRVRSNSRSRVMITGSVFIRRNAVHLVEMPVLSVCFMPVAQSAAIALCIIKSGMREEIIL